MNFYDLPGSLDADIRELAELVRGYKDGSVDKVKLKSFRVPMGIYEQREEETYMCRIRLPGGAVTPGQLDAIASIAQRYSDRPVHFTTRQEAQIHHVTLDDTVKILEELKKYGLSTRGGGGNTVRNIIGDVLSGIDEDTVFDISPYVRSLTSRLIAEKDSWSLPRKLKIAFSASSADRGLATVNDLGFIAKLNNNNERGFSVYIAGGLGAKPQKAAILYEFVHGTEVYNISTAVKRLFDKYGNRKNKYSARLRFLYNKLGKEEFIRRFENELEIVRDEGHEPLELLPGKALKKGTIELPLFLGDILPEKLIMLSEILRKYGEDIVRATPLQNLLIMNISDEEAKKLKQEFSEQGFMINSLSAADNAVACAGASTCRLGICLSRGLLEKINTVIPENIISNPKISDIKIKISGCPNSCGQHHIADIGFIGSAKRKKENPYPAYTVVMGGTVAELKTEIAEKIAGIPAKDVPDYLRRFLEFTVSEKNENESFRDYFIRSGKEYALRLAADYSNIPAFEEDTSYYMDWSSEAVFSLTEKLEGECSAGMFDLIEWDLQNIKDKYTEIGNSDTVKQKDLRELVLFASRALLITKGLEASTKMEAVQLFRDNFVGRHIDESFKYITDRYLNEDTLTPEETKKFTDAVKELYEAMDDSLKFPEIIEMSESNPEPDTSNMDERILDYRGVPCPMNYVKAKLILETMEEGEEVKILLDDGEPIENVPASIKEEGHHILDQYKEGNIWVLMVKKK